MADDLPGVNVLRVFAVEVEPPACVSNLVRRKACLVRPEVVVFHATEGKGTRAVDACEGGIVPSLAVVFCAGRDVEDVSQACDPDVSGGGGGERRELCGGDVADARRAEGADYGLGAAAEVAAVGED